MSKEDESTKLDIISSPEGDSSKNTQTFDEISLTLSKPYSEKSKTQNELETYPSIKKCLPKLTYGKYITFYYKDSDPIFAIGPDWPYFLVLFTLNIIFDIFITSILWENSYLSIKILGIIMCIFQLSSYCAASIINPGLPKAKYEFYANHPHKGNYRKCRECNLWINEDKGTFHCYDCACCVEGFDHHCPWTTKCVGNGNLYLFYIMLASTFMLFGYFIFSVVMMSIFVSNNHKN